jgi:predicted PurR-regulated permease PerM
MHRGASDNPARSTTPARQSVVHPVVDRLAAYSWRLLVIAGVVVGLLWLIGRLWVVLLPLVIAVLLARILTAPVNRLRSRGWRPGLAAAVVLVGFLVVLASAFVLAGIATAGRVDRIGPAVTRAVDDIEEWLVEDAPLEISRADIQQFREDTGAALGEALRTSSGSLVSGAVVAVEILISFVLGLIVTFFVLKDGDRLLRWVEGLLPRGRRELAGRLAGRAWRTIGGYLRGAALLGLVEGLIIGVALALVGAELAIPVAVVTFLLAFVPFAGAIVAGALAVLVALATAGGTAALIVLAVAIAVQQIDNDLLAPVIYGTTLEIHPVLILLSVVGGGALFGIAGSVLAVPVTAVVTNVLAEARLAARERAPDVE